MPKCGVVNDEINEANTNVDNANKAGLKRKSEPESVESKQKMLWESKTTDE